MNTQHAIEIVAGNRFEFGKNWARFLKVLNQDRINEAERSLGEMLGMPSLEGRSFLDVGSGSGIFSLAARRLGARVHSFDFDPRSVACTGYLRNHYFPGDAHWSVEAGSVLDRKYLATLGVHDVVYSWGVLHHTGDMWTALENVASLVAPDGLLWIAIYNDQGAVSRRWKWLKKTYNKSPRGVRLLLALASAVHSAWRPAVKDLLRLRPFATIRNYGKSRGMSFWHDTVDWIGGYPFEVAKPEQIFDFYRVRGFHLKRMKTTNSLRCNEFVFNRSAG